MGEHSVRPYRGAEPYRFNDGELFFGRDAAARRIVETVLSTPVTILHAPSGAGKTSLLNTRILAGLEANGLTPVLVRLWNAPVESVRQEIAHQAFPKPDREVACLERARRALELDGTTGLVDAVDRFDGLRGTTPGLTHELLQPIGGHVPFAARFLNGTLEPDRYLEALNFVTAGRLWAPGDVPASHRQIALDDLRERLSSSGSVEAHADLVSSLVRGEKSLAAVIEETFEICAGALRDFELMLCFDQFEEIFTRFRATLGSVDRTGAMQSWEVRENLFGQIEALCRTAFALDDPPRGSGASSRYRLRVCLLFSLRDEFFSRMDRLREFLPANFVTSYHLGLMAPSEAKEAIVQPAARFGVGYEDRCLERMLADLTIERRFVEPSQLSIVCDRFWSRTRDLRERRSDTADTLTHDDLEAMGFVEGLLRAIVTDLLADFDERERLEALDLIRALQSEQGIRQIVPEDALERRPLRTEIRTRILERLKARYFIRVHEFRGANLIEVTHETLLRAFNQVLREEQAEHPEFFQMEALLRRLEDADSQVADVGGWRSLHRRDLEGIETVFDYVDWSRHPGVCELVLRSWLIQTGFGQAELIASVERWAEVYRGAVATEEVEDPREAFLRHPSRWRLRQLEPEAGREWSNEERARMLRALIQLDRSPHATLTAQWTSRMTRT